MKNQSNPWQAARALFEDGWSHEAISQRTGLPKSTVSRRAKDEKWKRESPLMARGSQSCCTGHHLRMAQAFFKALDGVG
ncbi:MAG: hypothetical protein ABL933_15735 [Methyloglobulus sp.]